MTHNLARNLSRYKQELRSDKDFVDPNYNLDMMSCINVPPLAPPSKSGQIQVIFGPMFSGKTTELMRRMKRFLIANYKCLIIKYAKDDRYSTDGIATHDNQTLQAVGATVLSAVATEAAEHEVIGVDEGQFFPDIVSFCEQMADMGKVVIVAALDGTFQRQGFGNILHLVPLAESVVKLTAVCMSCYGEASFTKRKGEELAVEVIGGTEKYLAVCRACYKPSTTSPMCSPANRAKHAPPARNTQHGNEKRRLFTQQQNLPLHASSHENVQPQPPPMDLA